MILDSFQLTNFNWLDVLKIHSHCHKWQCFIFPYRWVVLHCMYVPHLLCPVVHWMRPCLFHALATVKNVAMNIRVHISLQIKVFHWLGRYSEEGLLGQMVNFWGASLLFFIVAVPVYILTGSKLGFLFLYNLPNTCYYLLITAIPTDVSFDVHFPNS